MSKYIPENYTLNEKDKQIMFAQSLNLAVEMSVHTFGTNVDWNKKPSEDKVRGLIKKEVSDWQEYFYDYLMQPHLDKLEREKKSRSIDHAKSKDVGIDDFTNSLEIENV